MMRTKELLLMEIPIVAKLDRDAQQEWADGLGEEEKAFLAEIFNDMLVAITQLLGDITPMMREWGRQFAEWIALGIQPSYRHIMRRKVRRAQLLRAAAGRTGVVKRRGSNVPLIIDLGISYVV